MTSEMKDLIAQNPWVETVIKQSFIAGYAQAHLDLANRLKTIAALTEKVAPDKATEFYKSIVEAKSPPGREND